MDRVRLGTFVRLRRVAPVALLAGCFNPGGSAGTDGAETVGLGSEATGASTSNADGITTVVDATGDGLTTSGAAAACGDGTCDPATEDCTSCVDDCGMCAPSCGGACDTVADCPVTADAVCYEQSCACACDEADPCLQCTAPRAITDDGPRLYVVHLAAADAPPELTQMRAAAINRAVRGLQDFFSDTIGPAHASVTFRAEPVRVWTSPYTTAEWEQFSDVGYPLPDGTVTDGCGALVATEQLFGTQGLLSSHGLPASDSDVARYLVVVGGGTRVSCVTNYIAVSEFDALFTAPGVDDDPGYDHIADDCPTGRVDACATTCDGAGYIAANLGFLFGLQGGVAMCTNGPSLMDMPWAYDDGATLCDEERSILASSPFFAAP